MSRRVVGFGLLLVGSLVLGILGGQSFYGLFMDRLPPAAMSDQVRRDSHFWFLLHGLIVGAVLFLWSLVVVAITPLLRSPKKREGSS